MSRAFKSITLFTFFLVFFLTLNLISAGAQGEGEPKPTSPLETKITELQKELKWLRQDNSSLWGYLDSLEAKTGMMKESVGEFEKTTNIKFASLEDRMEAQIEELKKADSSLWGYVDAVDAKATSVRENVRTIERRLDKELEAISDKLGETKRELENTDSQLWDYVDTLQAKMEILSESLGMLEKEFEDQVDTLSKEVANLREEIKDVESGNSELWAQIVNLNERLAYAKEDRKKLSKRLSQLEQNTIEHKGKEGEMEGEISPGEPLFFEDFSGEELSSNWKIDEIGGAKLGIEKGYLTLVGKKEEDQILKAFVGNPSWRNYILSVDIRFKKCGNYWGGYHEECPWDWNNRIAIFLRALNPHNMVGFFVHNGHNARLDVKRHGIWQDREKEDEKLTGQLPKLFNYHVVILAEDNSITATVNGETIAKLENSPFNRGYVGLQCSLDGGQEVYFDNLEVYPIE